MRLSITVATVLALAALAGCGSSDEATTEGNQPATTWGAATAPAGAAAKTCTTDVALNRVLLATGVGCAEAKRVAAAWSHKGSCAVPDGQSRFACSVDGYRCQGTAAGRGLAVSCAKPQHSIAFVAKPD